MDSIIQKQLKKCKVAQIPPWDESTTILNIPKAGAMGGADFIPEHYYIIELENYVMDDSQIAMNLSANWNNGLKPSKNCKHMKCQVLKIMGKMVKITGIGFNWEDKIDLDCSFEGWLPLKSIKQLKEIID